MRNGPSMYYVSPCLRSSNKGMVKLHILLMLLANQVAGSRRAKWDWRVVNHGIFQTQFTNRCRLMAIAVADSAYVYPRNEASLQNQEDEHERCSCDSSPEHGTRSRGVEGNGL
jgi:hypothetical protein